MSDIYLQITETPTVVTLSAPVVASVMVNTVTVANVVSVNVVTMPAITVQAAAPSVTTVAGTVTIGSCVTHGVNVANSVTISSLPSISGTVTANIPEFINEINVAKGIAIVGYNDEENSLNILGTSNVDLRALRVEPISLPPISGTVTANVFGQSYNGSILPIPVEQESELISDKFIPIGYNNDGDARQVSINYPLPSAVYGYNPDNSSYKQIKVTSWGDVSAYLGYPIPSGTNRIGVVTIGGGTVTIGAGTAQIGSVTASISGTVPVSISSVTIGNTVTVAGTVTANIASTTVTISAQPSGALTTRFGSVTTANLAQISSAVTNTSRKYLLAQNISTGTVTIGIGFSPTTTQGIQLTAGAGLTFDSFVPTGAVYWLGATTGAAYTILEG